MSTPDSSSIHVASKSEHKKDEIPSSSPLSSLSGPSSPLTPLRPRRKVTATKRYASPSRDEVKSIPRRPKKKAAAAKRTPKKPKWDSENILKDPKSPLATANLRSILCNPMAWTALDQDEKTEILSLFPDKRHILDSDTEDARPNFASLMNDDSFRYDCAAYTDNIAQGRYDPDWLASAWSAHERRKAGDFDKYLIDKLEEDWGVEIPGEMKVRRAPPEEETGDDAAREQGGPRKRKLEDWMEMDELAA
ncbi:hypothetical protein TARUN_9705 [Trichoderma arundinaceum]|uniref:ASX DEUBAD domain-containing protein n=1 Tax=Trichoderma arundinaceum TaxID=490622 RepID=A0A395N8U4_TRIAR|nr:hypothetical protein TARUN_9705 [Trichoderma arundinaceum]